jgi:LacI family transcriptional regulator
MRRSGFFGFVTDVIAITPYAGKIIEGAQDAAWNNGKILMLVNTKANPQIESSAIDLLLLRRVEGVIYATMYHHPVILPAALRVVPVVLLDCFVEDHQIPSVVPDEFGGGFEATKHLLDRGYQRIGYINDSHVTPASVGRLEGYRAALAAFGVSFDPDLVCSDVSKQEGGYRCAQQLLMMKSRPQALFCFNDRMAMGAYDAIRKLNYKIPHDVAVVGFDNQELIAADLYPPLTTMELPHYAMGAWAVQKLVKILSGAEQGAPDQHKITCPLIERASA